MSAASAPDPLEEDNILYVGVGPITGFLGAITSINGKSPLTLRGGTSHMNGHFGNELIQAGYNAGILLTGKSPKPAYLYICEGATRLNDGRTDATSGKLISYLVSDFIKAGTMFK